VQGYTQRVEIAAGFHRAIHAAGLLGRHMCERARNDFGWRSRLAVVWWLRGNSEAGSREMREGYFTSRKRRRRDVNEYPQFSASRMQDGDSFGTGQFDDTVID